MHSLFITLLFINNLFHITVDSLINPRMAVFVIRNLIYGILHFIYIEYFHYFFDRSNRKCIFADGRSKIVICFNIVSVKVLYIELVMNLGECYLLLKHIYHVDKIWRLFATDFY